MSGGSGTDDPTVSKEQETVQAGEDGAGQEPRGHLDAMSDGAPSRLRAWAHRTWEPILVMALSSLAFVAGFGGGWGRLSAPLGSGDIFPTYLAARMWGAGTPFGNGSIGFPFGIEQRYYPTADVLQNLVAGVATALTGSPILGMNLVFALSFPATGLAMWWVLRLARVSGPIAVVLAVALTVIPFHWYRQEHLYLATMYSAVLGVGVALVVGSGQFEERRRRGWRGRAPFALVCLVVALSGIYYAAFTVMLVGVAVVYRAARGARWRALAADLLPAAVVTVGLAAALMPSWLYQRAHPALVGVAERSTMDSVTYSGMLANLFLPAPFSQVPGFGWINGKIHEVAASETQILTISKAGVLWWSNFGSLFTLMAIVVLGVGAVLVARRRVAGVQGANTRLVSLSLIGTLLVMALLFFVPWGLNYLFAELVTSQLRGWDRLVPAIFTLVFVGAGVVLSELGLSPSGLRSFIVSGVLLVVLALDSVLPRQDYFDSVSAVALSSADQAERYATALNEEILDDCAVLQLPYVRYPESPPKVELTDYGHLLVALTNPEKSWSYGAMKDTLASEWLDQVGDSLDPEEILGLADVGFCAVHLDLRGYSEADRPAITSEMTELLGAPLAVSDHGQWLAFEIPNVSELLDPATRSMAGLRDEQQVFLAPPSVEPISFVALGEKDTWHERWWLVGDPALFTITSIEESADFGSVEFELGATECAAREVVVTLAGGGRTVVEDVSLGAGETRSVVMELGAPTTYAELTVDPGDASLCAIGDREFSLQVIDPIARY